MKMWDQTNSNFNITKQEKEQFLKILQNLRKHIPVIVKFDILHIDNWIVCSIETYIIPI